MSSGYIVRAFIDHAAQSSELRSTLLQSSTPEEVVEVARERGFDIDADQLRQSLLGMPMRTLFEAGLEPVMVACLPATMSQPLDDLNQGRDNASDSSSTC